jgi:hypothetical protein
MPYFFTKYIYKVVDNNWGVGGGGGGGFAQIALQNFFN